jgi:hypothetical protein
VLLLDTLFKKTKICIIGTVVLISVNICNEVDKSRPLTISLPGES